MLQPVHGTMGGGNAGGSWRSVLNGIFWVLRSWPRGATCPSYGPCTTCYHRCNRWRTRTH
ncbi:transposase [Novosphingobium sp. NBM11]|nr:transposase [Novosphingobium sp. NBM11]